MLFLLLAFVQCNSHAEEAKNSYVDEFTDYYLAILNTIQSDPQTALDSLKSRQTTSNTDQAQLQLTLSRVYATLEYPEKALEHSLAGIRLLDVSSEPWLIHFLNIARIDALNRMEQGFTEIDSLTDSLDWSKENNHDILTTVALLQLSFLYINLENYTEALKLLQQTADTAPKEGFINQSHIDSQMGGIYVYRNEFELALPFFQSSYAYQKSQNNILGMSIDLFEMGRANLEINNEDLGISQLQQSIDLSHSINDVQGVAFASSELAYHFIQKKDYLEAEKLLLASNQNFEASGNTYMLFDSLIQLSGLYTKTGQLEQADKYLSAAKNINEGSPLKYGKSILMEQQASLLSAMKKPQEAYELLLESIDEQRRLESKLSAEKLHEIRTRYEVEANNMKSLLLTEQNTSQAQLINKQSKDKIILWVFVIVLGLLLFLLVVFNRKLKKQSAKLHELANFDELSGLMNRSNTIKTIRNNLIQLTANDSFTLVMIDLDNFKSINDNYGHALGDKVLALFGTYCQELSEHSNMIGRFGGEEFLIGFVGSENSQIFHLIEALRVKTSRMNKLITAPNLKVTLSAGICHSNGSHRFRDILKHADEAMYQSKNNGRNQIQASYLN